MIKWLKEHKQLKRKQIEIAEREVAAKEAGIEVERSKERTRAKMMQMMQAQNQPKEAPEYKAPWLPPGVVPSGATALVAQDSCSSIYEYAGAQEANFFPSFLGYPALAMLTQSSDYRSVPETTATEMTREWGKFTTATSGADQDGEADARQEKIGALEDEFKRMNIRGLIQRAIEVEMSMGRAQIYIDLGEEAKDDLPFVMSHLGVKKGALRGFTLIEPMWSTPSVYNANDPTSQDFYVPQKWFVLGKDTHADRLITIIMRPVPQIMKPAYNFGGTSMLQLMVPYVQRYQRTADSVAELVRAFSLTILSTDMAAVLGGSNDPNIMMRASLFNQHRDNTGLMLLDKESEEISQINTPLTGLADILTKSQEQMAGPSHTPLVKLLGVTPSGLNANSDGEIRVYYDYIMAQNEAHIRPVIERISSLIQLSLWGEIDESIVWKFNPLYQLDEKEQAEVQKIKAETNAVLIESSQISQQEARESLANDENSGYTNIAVNDVPEPMGLDYETQTDPT